jgi:hypothetical protein
MCFPSLFCLVKYTIPLFGVRQIFFEKLYKIPLNATAFVLTVPLRGVFLYVLILSALFVDY